ncbi:MAG: hypothetical protein FWH23_03775 [Bacteroidales bacterium]|nr:hypothetical protein [Bacteroidales bacterium]MCL2133113.1 hypothetical protein [Bacteroidales bacterium]
MKKIFLLSILSVALLSFYGCSKDKDESNPIADEYFTIANSSYQSGALPSATAATPFSTINMNSSVIPGGSSFITVTNDDSITEFYLAVNGVEGYLVVPAATTRADNIYNLILLISQNLARNFSFIISGRTSSGQVLSATSINLTYVAVGSGALQVSLSFDKSKDVDLYVVRPNGQVIYYGNRGGYDDEGNRWGLDLDSNPGCSLDHINNENVFFPAAYLLNGKYEVWVNLYSNCDTSVPVNWVIITTRNGALVNPSFGQNPATGSFPANEPSNSIGGTLNERAVKVMEFTVTGGVSADASYMPFIQLPSAIQKQAAIN